MYCNSFHYTPADVDCRAYSRDRCAAPGGCVCVAERIEAGVVGYSEALCAVFPKRLSPALRARLRFLTESFTGSLWENAGHEERFRQRLRTFGYLKSRDTPRYFAALFALTADPDVWRAACGCFDDRGFHADRRMPRDLPPNGCGLLRAADDLCRRGELLLPADLADSEAVDTASLRVMANALLIARFGLDALKITF